MVSNPRQQEVNTNLVKVYNKNYVKNFKIQCLCLKSKTQGKNCIV